MPIIEPLVAETEAWFEDLIAQLKADQVQLETQTAGEEKKVFYDTLMKGTASQIALLSRKVAQETFVPQMVVAFLKSIQGHMPEKLAIDYNDSQVLLWAEIKDHDEETENKLILAEAKVNAAFHPFGFDMVSTIVETSDKAKAPNHYKIIK